MRKRPGSSGRVPSLHFFVAFIRSFVLFFDACFVNSVFDVVRMRRANTRIAGSPTIRAWGMTSADAMWEPYLWSWHSGGKRRRVLAGEEVTEHSLCLGSLQPFGVPISVQHVHAALCMV